MSTSVLTQAMTTLLALSGWPVYAVAGDAAGFWSGRRLGPRLRGSRLGHRVGEARWDRAGALLGRRGPWAIVLGRWVGVLRALTPTVAGASGMPLRRFLPASALGAASWATTVVLLGWSAGATLARAQAVLGALTGVALGAGAVAVLVGWVVARRRRARGAAAPLGAADATGAETSDPPTRELVAAATGHPGV